MQTLNSKEAAACLKIDIETLYCRASAGEIPGAKAGKRWNSRPRGRGTDRGAEGAGLEMSVR